MVVLNNILAWGPAVWCVDDDIVVFRYQFSGPFSCHFHSIVGKCSSYLYPQCFLVSFPMLIGIGSPRSILLSFGQIL